MKQEQEEFIENVNVLERQIAGFYQYDKIDEVEDVIIINKLRYLTPSILLIRPLKISKIWPGNSTPENNYLE
jgi:hypothetical protein